MTVVTQRLSLLHNDKACHSSHTRTPTQGHPHKDTHTRTPTQGHPHKDTHTMTPTKGHAPRRSRTRSRAGCGRWRAGWSSWRGRLRRAKGSPTSTTHSPPPWSPPPPPRTVSCCGVGLYDRRCGDGAIGGRCYGRCRADGIVNNAGGVVMVSAIEV